METLINEQMETCVQEMKPSVKHSRRLMPATAPVSSKEKFSSLSSPTLTNMYVKGTFQAMVLAKFLDWVEQAVPSF